MNFLAPQWFLLVPVLAAAAWQWPRLGLHRPLRIVCLALIVLLLAGPRIRRKGDGLDLWVLVDQSESARESMQPRLGEWQTILEKSRGPDDRVLFVDFAGDAVTRGALLRAGAAPTEYAGSRDHSNAHGHRLIVDFFAACRPTCIASSTPGKPSKCSSPSMTSRCARRRIRATESPAP